jgi:hypothetical protein
MGRVVAAQRPLLGQDPVAREARADQVGDRPLGADVDLGHQVDLALEADRADPPVRLAQDGPAGPGRLDGNLTDDGELLGHQSKVERQRSKVRDRRVFDLRRSTRYFWNRAEAAGATFSGGIRTIAPLSHEASHR